MPLNTATNLTSNTWHGKSFSVDGIDTDSDGMIDVPGVSDLEIGMRAYSRAGN